MNDPKRYESFKSVAARDAAEFVPQLIAGMTWKSNEIILDYGCGAGSVCKNYFVPMAQLYNSQIEAVDISNEMITFALNHNADQHVNFYKGNIMDDDSPVNGKLFDKIFSINVFQFINDSKTALKRLFDVLKPGGQLGFTVVARTFNLVLNLHKNPKWNKFVRKEDILNAYAPWYGTEVTEPAEVSLRRILEEVGFVISDLRTVERKPIFDVDTITELLLAINVFIGNKIPHDLQIDLKNYYRESILDLYGVKGSTLDQVQPIYDTIFCIASKP